jgi:hypothetical protein
VTNHRATNRSRDAMGDVSAVGRGAPTAATRKKVACARARVFPRPCLRVQPSVSVCL